jgi:hypothetical protein
VDRFEGTGARGAAGGAAIDDSGGCAARWANCTRRMPCAIRWRRRCTATTRPAPLLIQVGTREILLDDSTRIADKSAPPHAGEAGNRRGRTARVAGDAALPETADAVRRIGAFVRERIPA